MKKHFLISALYLVAAGSVSAQPDDSNGFDMGQVYKNQQPEAFSDAGSEYPVEGHEQGTRSPYQKYQFKNAGASKIIIPELNTGAVEISVPAKAEPAAPAPSTEEEQIPSPAAAAVGDASYYQNIISKVKAQGDSKAASESEKNKVSDYKF